MNSRLLFYIMIIMMMIIVIPRQLPPSFFSIMITIVNPRQLPPCILSYDSDNGHVDCCLLGFFLVIHSSDGDDG